MPVRFHITTLGCPKNVVDSENMALLLRQAGHAPSTEHQADVIIVNTCGFIDAARQESLGEMRSVLRRKRLGQAVVAAGCLVQRDGDALPQRLAGLDALLSTRQWRDIVGVVEDVAARRGLGQSSVLQPALVSDERRATAYVKIADGCDRRCAFCTIPSIKGDYASRPADEIAADVRRLAAEGVKEITLVAQETSAYGADLGEGNTLADLLPRLAAAAPSVPWLRFLYTYPTTVTPRLIDAWARLPQVVRYLDMPLQHAHPDVLRRMRRPYDMEGTQRVLDSVRRALPGLALRTTFIVGYPGETEAEFQTLLDFMSAQRFDNVGVFAYSPEPGTPAAAMPEQVAPRLREERRRRAMLHQQAISLAANQALVGATLQVLIEGQAEKRNKKADPLVVGRSYRHAPEIDGLVFARGQAAVGDMVQVRVTGATEYDLWGDVIA